MDLGCFALLLIVSVVVSAVLHYVFKYYVAPGIWSLLSKIVVGWIGAWLGSPVFGHWGPGVISGNVYIIPATLGSFALLIVAIDLMKAVAKR